MTARRRSLRVVPTAPALLRPDVLRAALLALAPSGLQGRARRNAWAGRSELSALSRARREAEAALAAAAAAVHAAPEERASR